MITPLNTKTEGVMANGSNLILTAFSNQLSVSRADVGRLRAAISAHWRGELGLFAIFVKCPTFAACIAGSMLALTLSLMLLRFSFPMVIYGAFLVGILIVSILGSIWWSLGCIRKSNNLLSDGRFLTAAFVYVVAISFGISSAHFLGLQCLDISSSLSQQVKEYRERHEYEASEKKKWVPWSVIAIPELSRVIASGSIGYGSTEALEKIFRENPSLKLLQLNSPGGLVSEEQRIELLVKHLQLDTVVLEECYSACTTVFLAGNRRFIGQDAQFGFHQSGYRGKPRTINWTIHESMASILFFEKGVSPEFAKVALNTPYRELWRPNPLDLKLAGYASDWWMSRGPEYR